MQSQLGTSTESCKGSMWNDLQFAGVASCHSFHSKSNMPNWQHGRIIRSVSRAVLPALPRVRSLTSMVLETEECQILSVLQYKQTSSQATELKTHCFQVCLFIILLLPMVLTEVTLGLLFYLHPTGDSISPSLSTAVTFECQPVPPSHNEQWTVSLSQRMWGGASYSVPILMKLQLQLFLTFRLLFKPGWNWPVAWKLPGKEEQLQKL